MNPESIATTLSAIHKTYASIRSVLEQLSPAPTWEQTLEQHAAFVDAVIIKS